MITTLGAQRNVTTWINTGASGELHFAIRAWKPKVPAVFGCGRRHLLCRICGVQVIDPVTGAVPINTGGGASHADLAFDALAGADYFFTPKWSAFIEYKYLNYQSTQLNTRQNRALGQQLVGAGVRFFF